jgi:RHS repeat-associated protein
VSLTQYSQFDALGRVLASQQTTDGSQPYVFHYVYDLAGQPTVVTYPSGRTLTTAWNYLEQPVGVTGAIAGSPPTIYAEDVSYAPHGGLAAMTLNASNPAALWTETWSYNSRLQVTGIGGTPGLNLSFDYGGSANNGNMAWQTMGRGAQTWTQNLTYDGVNRLMSAIETGQPNEWSQGYGYDQYGNRWVSSSTGYGLSTYTALSSSNFDGGNHLAMAGVTHDLAGNQTQLSAGLSMTYDADGRMETSTLNGTATAYVYDADGRRVLKQTGSAATVYVYDAFGQLAVEVGGAAPVLCTTCYLAVDALGSMRQTTDTTGMAVGCHDYLPFGEELDGVAGRTGGCWGAADTTLKFTGKERDSETVSSGLGTGLDFFGARYMSSAQGRFTSPDGPFNDQDPSNPQSWNLYSYVRNNPLRSIDPTGRECVTLDSGAKGDDGQGTTCATANLDLTHGVTVYSNGDSISGVFGNAAQRGDLQSGSIESETASIGVGIIGGEAAGLVVGRVGGAIADLFGGAGRTAATTAARVTRGGLGPVLKGTAGVERAAAEIEAEGGQVLGREITIENSAGRARVDIAYRDASGNLRLGEAKNGPTADLNPNQQRVYGAAQTEGARLVGGNAQSAGLPSTIGPGSVRVFKY